MLLREGLRVGVLELLERHPGASRHPLLDAVREGTQATGAFETWLAQDHLFVADLLVFQSRLLVRVVLRAQERFLLRAARIATLILVLPLVLIASQGYSVLYLFLVADLVCTAAAFPVFYGLYSERYTGLAAMLGTLAGLVAGAFVFPDPAMTHGSLLGAFILATGVSAAVSLALTPWRSRRRAFDSGSLARAGRRLGE